MRELDLLTFILKYLGITFSREDDYETWTTIPGMSPADSDNCDPLVFHMIKVGCSQLYFDTKTGKFVASYCQEFSIIHVRKE